MSEEDDEVFKKKHKLPPLPFEYEEIQSGSAERLKEIMRLLGFSKNLPRTEETMRYKILDHPLVIQHEDARKQASMSEGNDDLETPLSHYTMKNLRQLADELGVDHRGVSFGELKRRLEQHTARKKRKRIYFPDERTGPMPSPLVQVRIIPRAVQSPRTPRAKKRLNLGAPLADSDAGVGAASPKSCKHAYPKCLQRQCGHKCCHK